jgi:predicted enzyme related to lactoylglutathione lyase
MFATMADRAFPFPRHTERRRLRDGNVDTTAEHAVALGGQLLLPPTDTPGLRSAVIADPQHGVIAISAPT